MKFLHNHKRIFIFTNGCTRRKLDVQKLETYFKLNNCRTTRKLKEADYIIFVSCAFIKQRREESLKIIMKLIKYDGKLIVAGCLPEINRERLKKVFKGEVISTKHLYEIDKIFPEFKFKFLTIPDANFAPSPLFSTFLILGTKKIKIFSRSYNYLSLIKNTFTEIIKTKLISKKKSACFLRIQEGCLGNCSYCSIRKAIGPLKSKPLKVCIEEYKKMINKGYKNFVILGDDVGAYGLDIKTTFPELLESLSKIGQNLTIKWSIKELHPKWIIKYESELLKLIKQGKIKHMLCGVQSGSNRVLQLMNRYYNSNSIIKVLKKIKKVSPDLKLSTQIIIGFPSETEKDFLATLDLIKRIKFNEVLIYPYSKNEKSSTMNLKDEISDTIKKERIRQIIKSLKKEKINCYCDGI
jgi:tRNA A37 methylthiotransferase MiaB